MSRLLNYLKTNRIGIPIWLGLLLNKIPYSKRPGLGKLYIRQELAIKQFPFLSEKAQQDYIYEKFMKIFCHAYKNVKFYQDLYQKHSITPDDIQTFDDIQKIPLVTKQDLVEYDIEDRSWPIDNRLIVNTGGSSGKSFAFYMDPGRYGNEWAHVHDMWAKFDYVPSDLKLSFDGRAKKNNEIVYDFARNSLLFDIYADPGLISRQLLGIVKKYAVKYLHGYPSAIYEFALYCENDKELLQTMRKQLKAAFLSSEYPSPHYRQKIEDVFQIPTQSFYGHTETCVMAVEGENFIYDTYQTYGYAEAVNKDGKYHLAGTSYFNFASPLIRYDTSDLIEPLDFDSKILRKFTIKEGRLGEFILDKNNKKVPLTGLIYGRHHELFNLCKHIQIKQKNPGVATILYVSGSKKIMKDEAYKYFDSSNVAIEFLFEAIKDPILTKSGKINLLIKD